MIQVMILDVKTGQTANVQLNEADLIPQLKTGQRVEMMQKLIRETASPKESRPSQTGAE